MNDFEGMDMIGKTYIKDGRFNVYVYINCLYIYICIYVIKEC